jgi:uncharacterized membrane protein
MAHDLAYLDATIADLEARRDHLNSMIESLRQIREQGALPVPGVTLGSGGIVEQDVRHDSFFGMTILDAIKKYLAMTKQTQSAPDIADALVRGGMKSAAKDFVGNVRTTLSKNEAFVSVKNGEWGLSLWYPAKRKEKQSRATKPAKKKARTPSTALKDGKGEKKLSEKEQTVLEAVKILDAPCKPKELAEALQFNFNTTRVILYNLAKLGLIRRAEAGGFEKLSDAKQAKA